MVLEVDQSISNLSLMPSKQQFCYLVCKLILLHRQASDKRDHKIPFFAYRRNPLIRIAAARVVLLAGVWCVRVKQRTLTILDTNNISRQLRVMVFAKANFTVYTIDVGGHGVAHISPCYGRRGPAHPEICTARVQVPR